MTRVLVVGCGDLGGQIAQLLMASGHEVVGVRKSDKTLTANIPCIQADVTYAPSLTSIRHINPAVIIYCVAANAQTDESYRTHYVEGLRHVLATQETNTELRHVFFISSTRVYGQNVQASLDETVQPIPADFGGERLLEAEGLLNKQPFSATAVRLTGIYGPGRLYMVNMAKDASRWPASNKWTNRIHRDDAARFVSFLCGEVIAGKMVDKCYIGTDDMPTLQWDVLTWLASKLGVTPAIRTVNTDVGGKRLSNKKMRATGFTLKYANYQLGYSEILKSEVSKNG